MSPAKEKPGLLRHLRRETTTGLFLPEVDGLRFVAILSVVLFHVFYVTSYKTAVVAGDPARAAVERAVGGGGRGVLLFFCISGFILGLPFARHAFAGGKPVGLKAYFARRLTRLEPPYLLNLLIRLPFAMAVWHLSFAQALPHLVASVFYVHTLVYGVAPTIHPPSWSLEVEVQFYILAPFLATLLYRARPVPRRGALVAAILAMTVAQRLARIPEGDDLRYWETVSIVNHGQFFLAGLLAADLFHTTQARENGDGRLDAAGLLALPAFFYLPDPFARFALPFLALTLLWATLRGRTIKRWLSKPFVYVVGGMCYSLYLTHSMVLQGAFAVMARMGMLGSFGNAYAMALLLCLPTVLLVGAAYYALIERPCMDKEWPRKLMRRMGRRRG